MSVQERIEDLKAEIAAVRQEPTDEYYRQWEKDRDINRMIQELDELLWSK